MTYEAKTKPTPVSVADFIAAVENPVRRADAQALCALLAEVTGEPPVMWGASIVGFGRYHYRYESGHEGDAPLIGFSPRKANLVVYIAPGFPRYPQLMERLGRHKAGASCLYLNRLADIDLGALRELAQQSVAWMRAKYPAEPQPPS